MPSQVAFTPTFATSIDGLLCLSEFHKQSFPAHLQLKSIISPNGIDAKYIVDGSNEHNHFVYGSAPNRGLEYLLTAWPLIRNCVSDAQLTVYYGFTPAFVKFGEKNIPNYSAWKAKMDRLLQQDGVNYVGLVDHKTLAFGYANAGFYLYPTTFPETSCVTIMKAQALGAIPITSRFEGSALSESSGKYDLGPRPLNQDTGTYLH